MHDLYMYTHKVYSCQGWIQEIYIGGVVEQGALARRKFLGHAPSMPI